MTKIQAEELDELLRIIYTMCHQSYLQGVIIGNIYPYAYSLKDKDLDYVQNLFYKVRRLQEENKIPALIRFGDVQSTITFEQMAVRDFIQDGGFNQYYEQLNKKKWFERWQSYAAIASVLGGIYVILEILKLLKIIK